MPRRSASSSTPGPRSASSPVPPFPAFGMAEVCIAGSFPTPGKGLTTDWVDKRSLEIDHDAKPGRARKPRAASSWPCSGNPVPGLEIDDRRSGQRENRAPTARSVSCGSPATRSRRATTSKPEETAELLVDGWLHTGDLAYTVGGELVVCGRSKDVIIVGGRNVYPQDIEKVVGEIEGIRTGNVIAFGIDGRHGAQSIMVVAETKSGGERSRARGRPAGDRIGRHPAQGGRAGAGRERCRRRRRASSSARPAKAQYESRRARPVRRTGLIGKIVGILPRNFRQRESSMTRRPRVRRTTSEPRGAPRLESKARGSDAPDRRYGGSRSG